MQLSIVTINYKKPQLTVACIASLYKQYAEQFEKNLFEVIVVDNFSQDDSVAVLEKEIKKQKYKNVSVVANTVNSGFGGGNNFGVKHAKGEVVLLLNNDTVVGEGLDSMLVWFLDHPEVGILGGPLKNKNGSEQSSVGSFFSLFQTFLLLVGWETFKKNPQRITRVDWVKGALLMIRKDLYETLQGFDEQIFMYTEDMELCYRARQIGVQTYFYPDVAVIHEDQGSSSRSFAIINIYKGIVYFYKKHKSWVALQVVKFLLLSKAVLLILYGKLVKNEYLVGTYEKALNTL